MVTVKLIKSYIGATPKQRATLKALGLKKIRQESTLPDNSAVQGMISKVSHMVEVTR